MSREVILTPIAMVRPSKDSIRAPSNLRPNVVLTEAEFNEIADTGTSSLVSLEADGISNPQQITAYTVPVVVQGGLKGWVQRCIVSGEK